MTAALPARTKPRLRGVSHQAAFYAALGAGLTLVGSARSGHTALPLGVYALCMAAMFGISALYHRPDWGPVARLRMRRLDHCGIFLMIAGSYTPVCTLALPAPQGLRLLAAVWIGALAGIAQALLWVQAPKPVTAAIYLSISWLAAWTLPDLWRAIGPAGMALLLGGGLAYSAGAVVYAARRPDPAPRVFGYHEIFHALVVAAAISHYAMIVRVARGL